MSEEAKRELDKLKSLIESGEFHHATYRNVGTIWEGLHFYRKDEKGFRGFSIAGCINKSFGKEAMDKAHDILPSGSLSVGAYGEG